MEVIALMLSHRESRCRTVSKTAATTKHAPANRTSPRTPEPDDGLVPPVVFIVAAGIDALSFLQPDSGATSTVLAVAKPVVTHFPVMIGGTVLALLAGTVRLLMRRRPATSEA
jgi:hypothetical protein